MKAMVLTSLAAVSLCGVAHAQELVTSAEQVDANRPTHRRGFTFDLGAGLGYSSEYIDSDQRVAGMFAGSVGWFVTDRFAALLHLATSTAAKTDDQIVSIEGRDRGADRVRSATVFFIGPQAQWFPIDRLALGLGAGVAGRYDLTRVRVSGTHDGDSDDDAIKGGFGASARAAVTVYQRQDTAALRIGAEALPVYIDSEWRVAAGLMAELQVF